MVHYKVCYFNGRGRAEGVRFILAQAGVDFEDERITQEDWPKLKSSTPMGQLPVLYVDDKMICQSVAMARYVAKEHGLVPTNNFLAARADMIVDGLGDQYPHFFPYLMAMMKGNLEEADELWQAYKKEHLPNFLDIYGKLLTENGGKFFVGNQLTWADLIVTELLDRFAMFNKNYGGDSFLAGHKNLARLMKHVLDLPNIKKYVAKRPQTIG